MKLLSPFGKSLYPILFGFLVGIVGYFIYSYKSVKQENITLHIKLETINKDKNNLQKELDTCNDALESVGDFIERNSKIDDKTKSRINRVKRFNGDFVDFNQLF
jgi:predicted nuclease with TOPRIM domain